MASSMKIWHVFRSALCQSLLPSQCQTERMEKEVDLNTFCNASGGTHEEKKKKVK